ncbi:MAG: ATP synthase F0 sector subunit a, partial [uncultured Friedmanniella sp.]
ERLDRPDADGDLRAARCRELRPAPAHPGDPVVRQVHADGAGERRAHPGLLAVDGPQERPGPLEGPVRRRGGLLVRAEHARPGHDRARLQEVPALPDRAVLLRAAQQPVGHLPAHPAADRLPRGLGLRPRRPGVDRLQRHRHREVRSARLPEARDHPAGRADVDVPADHPAGVPLQHPGPPADAVAPALRQHVRRPPAGAGVRAGRGVPAAAQRAGHQQGRRRVLAGLQHGDLRVGDLRADPAGLHLHRPHRPVHLVGDRRGAL